MRVSFKMLLVGCAAVLGVAATASADPIVIMNGRVDITVPDEANSTAGGRAAAELAALFGSGRPGMWPGGGGFGAMFGASSVAPTGGSHHGLTAGDVGGTMALLTTPTNSSTPPITNGAGAAGGGTMTSFNGTPVMVGAPVVNSHGAVSFLVTFFPSLSSASLAQAFGPGTAANLSQSASPNPEPASLFLVAGGAAIVAARWRKRRRDR